MKHQCFLVPYRDVLFSSSKFNFFSLFNNVNVLSPPTFDFLGTLYHMLQTPNCHFCVPLTHTSTMGCCSKNITSPKTFFPPYSFFMTSTLPNVPCRNLLHSVLLLAFLHSVHLLSHFLLFPHLRRSDFFNGTPGTFALEMWNYFTLSLPTCLSDLCPRV